jgi:NAD(P)-dependent dehydrogenase (short-subunit alcohol dehydrogenase family)
MLEGKHALVTGGGRGIGAAIARKLAALGARVTVSGRATAELEAVAREIGGAAIRCDLLDRADSDRLIAAVGRVDVLVNNAGIAESASLERTDDALWDRVLEIDATAPYRLIRALAPGMVAAKWGRIVNVASNAGLSGYGYTSAYCAAKHAMIGFTRGLAIDLARTGVTVNAVCPGWVETEMAERAIANIAAKTGKSAGEARFTLEAMSPQRRMIQPGEVAHVVAMLCADDARGINGQAIPIDGGQVMK